jgi:hypothetical protein
MEFDEFQNLDLRLILGGGLGWRAVRRENTTFSLIGGGTFNKEFFSTKEDRSSGEILLGQEFTHKFSGRTTLTERFEILPNLTRSKQYRLVLDATVLTQLNTWLGWNITVSNRYVSDPFPGIKKNDLLLSTGITLTFGN